MSRKPRRTFSPTSAATASAFCEMLMFNCDIILALALYALLKPVNSTLALLGSFWRIANAIVLGAGAAGTFVALDLLSDAQHITAFTTPQLYALTSIFLDVHDNCSTIGLTFFCLGATVHSYLLFKSHYIPQILSAAYLCVVMQLLFCTLAMIVYPPLSNTFGLIYLLPDFVIELAVALWLSTKGANIPASERAEV